MAVLISVASTEGLLSFFVRDILKKKLATMKDRSQPRRAAREHYSLAQSRGGQTLAPRGSTKSVITRS